MNRAYAFEKARVRAALAFRSGGVRLRARSIDGIAQDGCGRAATTRAGCDGACRVRRHGRGARLRGLPKAKCADGATARADGGLLCLAFPRAFVIFVNLLYRRRYVWDNARLACFERELERLCGLDCCALCIRPFRICVQCRKASRTRRTIKWKHQLRSWRTIASR